MFDNHPHDRAQRGRGGNGPGFFPPFGGFGAPHGHGHHTQGHHGHGHGRPDFPFPVEAWQQFLFGMFGGGPGGRGGRGPQGGGPDGGGFGGPRRPDRLLEQGDLRWLVLDLIAVQARHGYEIIKAIEDMLSGHYTPSPGVIYPTLTYLEETGLITGETQGSKKLYSITEEGRSALEANAAAVQAIRTRIEAIRARFGASAAPELMRAMGNLRTAIQIRLSKGEISPESLSAITAAIDRAASEIERS